MRSLKKALKRLFSEECAATATEYAIMLMLIAGAVLSTVQIVGSETGGFWNGNSDEINSAFDDSGLGSD